jgi:hypothetical protein
LFIAFSLVLVVFKCKLAWGSFGGGSQNWAHPRVTQEVWVGPENMHPLTDSQGLLWFWRLHFENHWPSSLHTQPSTESRVWSLVLALVPSQCSGL